MVDLESYTALAGTLSSACWGERDVGRCPISECLVRSRIIIEQKIRAQPMACFTRCGVVVQMDLLLEELLDDLRYKDC
jgi:hypothetical protein